MKQLEEKVALVTGASLGIGRAIALRMAEEGADVVINYRSHIEEAQEVARQVQSMGKRALIWQADVAERGAVEKMFVAAVDQLGSVDIAVANAGMSIRKLVVEAEWEDIRRTIEVNQFGTFHTCQLAAQQMVQQFNAGRVGGKILIISSVLEEIAPPTSAAYNMAKAAVNHLGRTMALELARYKINVNMLNPGWIDTPGERAFVDDATILQSGKRIPWGRLGTSEDIANAAAFLCGIQADYVTGATLRVDGGFVLGLRLPEAQ
jgi:glucose 1-dehydrogenase